MRTERRTGGRAVPSDTFEERRTTDQSVDATVATAFYCFYIIYVYMSHSTARPRQVVARVGQSPTNKFIILACVIYFF